MKKTTMVLSGAAVLTGALAALLAAPLFHTHAEPEGLMSPMWAHPYPSLEEMALDADAVVLATVLDTRPGRVVPVAGGERFLPFSLVDLGVEQTLRGAPNSFLVVEQTGGMANDVWQFVEGDGGPYHPGERVLLFLKKQPDTDLWYVSHPKGRFRVIDGVVHAVVADDPVSAKLDRRPLGVAVQEIASLGG